MAYSHCSTPKRSFSHLNEYERGMIKVLWDQKHSKSSIARMIGCHRSTISRELQRGTVTQRRHDLTEYQAYFPEAGQAVYEKNRANCGAKFKFAKVAPFIHFAVDQIQNHHWSPDAVCGYARHHMRFNEGTICTKTLYAYIDFGLMPVKNIDLPLKVSRKTKSKRVRKNRKIFGKSIEDRPAHIDDRSDFGHWEIDTVVGTRSQGQAMLTLTERKTRFEHILRIGGKTAHHVHVAIQELKKHYGEQFASIFKTITSDNGSEFSELTEAIQCKQIEIYYTHPYTSSERGTNERHNGLIRRFIPKGKTMDMIDDNLISYVERWCNTLPRKILDYYTPSQKFDEELNQVC